MVQLFETRSTLNPLNLLPVLCCGRLPGPPGRPEAREDTLLNNRDCRRPEKLLEVLDDCAQSRCCARVSRRWQTDAATFLRAFAFTQGPLGKDAPRP